MEPSTGEKETLAAKLTAAFARRGQIGVRIGGLTRLSTGASQDSWALEAVADTGTRGLILRRMPEGATAETFAAGPVGALFGRVFFAAQAVEAALLESLEGAAAPLPSVAFALEPEDDLGQGFLMERLPGTAEARKILREPRYEDARSRLGVQMGAAAAGIANADLAALPDLPTIAAADWIAGFRDLADALDLADPIVETTLKWLEAHCPDPEAPRLVHGDFRLGNVLVDDTGLAGVIDWELAHLGDPVEDLGWMCIRSWRFSKPGLPAAGVASREALLDAYSAAGGQADADRLRFWEVMGNLRWAMLCLYQAYRHLSGTSRSVELAAIGRRYHEPLYDLVELLEGRDG